MVLENKLSIIFLVFLLLPVTFYGELPELATKQPIKNIRYVSNDGLLTYFQNGRGKLLYSSNYNISTVMSKSPGTLYSMVTSPHKKFFIIEVQEDFFKVASFHEDSKIYSLPFGDTHPTYLGKGQGAKLQNNGKWAHYYSFQKHLITLVNLEAPLVRIGIKIHNNVLPYFNPEVLLFHDNFIFYTDVNKKGEQAIILQNRETKKKIVFLQSDIFGQTFQLCQNNKSIFIFQTGQNNLHSGSQIYKLDKNAPLTIKSLKSIYTSTGNDIGQLVCNFDTNHLFFIKNKQSTKYTATKNVVMQIDLETNKQTIIYNDKAAFNIFLLDRKLMVSSQGHYYILKGKLNLKDDSIN